MAALLEKDRNRIYTEFRKTLGEEATQALLSQFPTPDVDELVTRNHLDRRLAEVELKLTNRMVTVAALQTAVIGTLIAIFR
jgi:hypothetical protein